MSACLSVGGEGNALHFSWFATLVWNDSSICRSCTVIVPSRFHHLLVQDPMIQNFVGNPRSQIVTVHVPHYPIPYIVLHAFCCLNLLKRAVSTVSSLTKASTQCLSMEKTQGEAPYQLYMG